MNTATFITMMIAFGSLCLGFVAMMRTHSGDAKATGAEMGVLKTDVQYIKENTDKMNKQLEKMQEKIDIQGNQTNERILRVETELDIIDSRVTVIEKHMKGVE